MEDQLWYNYPRIFLYGRAGEQFYQQTFTEFVMPRQSGVTTFLKNEAISASSKGSRVLFIAQNYRTIPFIKRELPREVDVDTIPSDREWQYKGKDYDLILIDGVRKFFPSRIPLELSIRALTHACMKGNPGKILMIGTDT